MLKLYQPKATIENNGQLLEHNQKSVEARYLTSTFLIESSAINLLQLSTCAHVKLK